MTMTNVVHNCFSVNNFLEFCDLQKLLLQLIIYLNQVMHVDPQNES
jgi:hypothetical protein